jgi:nucleotide-binding universal stress UspA family protein
MKILVGVDSKFSGDISQAIVTQFRPENTEILILHVLQPAGPTPPQMDPGYAPELEGKKKPAHALVEHIAKELRDAGFEAGTAIKVGDIREVIIDSAAEWRADLIIVGSHGQRGIQRFLLGSVSEFVARHANCSVEIIRPPRSMGRNTTEPIVIDA